MAESFLRRPLVPVGNQGNASAVAAALTPYVDTAESVTVVHIIEKAGGAPDKASVEQREILAEEVFATVTEDLRDTDNAVETELLYGTDVAASIIDAAQESGATAIVFTPRTGSRWKKLLSGDVSHKLLNNSDLPVLVLPGRDG